jgi:MFS transporter, DHA1 family, multidrug resistance protein
MKLEQMSFTPPERAGLAVLVVISALQPFALNVLAPATPALAEAFSTDYATIQLTLSLYLTAVALTQLVVGPLSDRYGRRPCVLIGIGMFTFGALLAALAPSTGALLVARIVQGAGAGTAFALSRAIVRDTSEQDEAASRIGYLTMVMVLSPLFAPLIGGVIDARFGWRAIFVLMVLMGCGALLVAASRLPETRPRELSPMQFSDMFKGFAVLLPNRRFLGFALAMSFTSAAFFAFIAGAPYIVVDVMGKTPEVYGLYFMANALGYMAGNFVTGRYAKRVGADRMVGIGAALSVMAVIIEVLVMNMLPWTPATLFLPLVLNAIGNGLTLPCATAAALSVRPDIAGAAAGLVGALQLGIGAIMAFIAGATVQIWPPALIGIMGFCVCAGYLAHAWGANAWGLRARVPNV